MPSPAPYNFDGRSVNQEIDGNLVIKTSAGGDGNLTVAGATTLTGAVTAPGGFNSGTVTAFGGLATSPPVIVSPGTVSTGGTVSNTSGYDANVYASATTGISAAKIGTASVPGSVAAGQTADYYVPNGVGITLTYAGNLTWLWLAV